MAVEIIALMFVTGFLSGMVNAIAGGGTFLTFGAMTFIGVGPISANATSSIVQFPGYITSALAYLKEIRKNAKSALILGIISLIGGLVGALLLLSLDNVSFRPMVPWLLLVATALFAAGPLFKPRQSGDGLNGGWKMSIGQFITSIYGGFFGAGMGIMMLAVLGLTSSAGYHALNAMKNFLAVIIAAVAIVVFVGGGVVHWPSALAMIPGSALGGYAGVYAARRVPQWIIRALVIGVGLFLTGYYFLTA
jgi:uncharacterized membrane protein YfcA